MTSRWDHCCKITDLAPTDLAPTEGGLLRERDPANEDDDSPAPI